METKWLEDFVLLAETHSFSRSAALRHITQPAFSRRIQALESWVGVELVDRSVFPTRLTEAGQVFHAQALAILAQAREAQVLLRGRAGTTEQTLDLAVPHTLSLTYLPGWLQRLQQGLDQAGAVRVPRRPRLHVRLRALNVHDATIALVEGGCDLMMAYHHPSRPIALDPGRYESVVLGTEAITAYAAPDAHGAPRFTLPGSAAEPVPYLAYAPNAYLGRMTEVILSRANPMPQLEKVYETDMAEGLKEMALAGHGIAFLPASAAASALARARLVALDEAVYSLTMEIRLYRDRLNAGSQEPRARLRDAVWAEAVRLIERDAKKT